MMNASTVSDPEVMHQLTESESISKACVFLVQHEDLDESTLQRIQDSLKPVLQDSGHANDVILLSSQAASCDDEAVPSLITIRGHLLSLFRQYGLHRNEREVVLSAEDQLVAVQLCLAQGNKQKIGDFDVEVSKVVEYNGKLEEQKLRLRKISTETTDPLDISLGGNETDFKDFEETYQNFLLENNIADWMDVLKRLQQECHCNEALAKSIQQTNYVLVNPHTNFIERRLVDFLVEGKRLKRVQLIQPLDDSLVGGSTHVEISVEDCDDTIALLQTNASRPSQKSVTESYVEHVFLGYLHLLVNSRSEVALARVINIPERKLDHQAFTEIKKEAARKGMSMYQTVTSFVMKIRLGGKGYAPESSCPLMNHVKGLAEFTDMMHKLQTIIEEDFNSKSAVTKVLNVLKNTIIKSADNQLRRQSVEMVRDRLLRECVAMVTTMEVLNWESPQRDANCGGSLLGRRTVRVFRSLLDHFSGLPYSGTSVDMLTDAITSQGTPVRFPSLMTRFRSPLEVAPDSAEAQSLAQRMLQKQQTKKKSRVLVARQQACLDWAAPAHGSGWEEPAPVIIDDFIPSKTIVHPGCHPVAPRRVVESVHDQENTDSSMHHASAKEVSSAVEPTKASGKTSKNNKRSREGEDCSQVDAAKEVATQKNKKAKISRAKSQSKSNGGKKVIPLQKGQQTLGAFFRI